MSFVSIFSIVGIIVLALAVIALAIIVAGISSRLKELTDAVMLEPLQDNREIDYYDDIYSMPPQNMDDTSVSDEFFETYRDRDNAENYSRGRGKPTIPFGTDRNVQDRRRETYAENVADSEYDPDSIDFTRVKGYRHFNERR